MIATDINPIPPICIIAKITSCPNTVQWVKVSNRIKPVTQVADVAVKKLSLIDVAPGPLVAMGRDNNNVPINITKQYPLRINWVGDIFFMILYFSFKESPPFLSCQIFDSDKKRSTWYHYNTMRIFCICFQLYPKYKISIP